MIRPVTCWYCGGQMHYAGHPDHEPEVRLTIDTGDADERVYLHARCWDEWQGRRPVAAPPAAKPGDAC